MAAQAKYLKSLFPEASVKYSSHTLTWIGDLKPSPLSQNYRVKVQLKKGKRPRIYVLAPRLYIPEGKSLPHVYSDNDLCLYYPDGKEWQEEKFLATTILPWTSEWLYHYEVWLASDAWCGGGVHPTK